jgi:hypothetical protein
VLFYTGIYQRIKETTDYMVANGTLVANLGVILWSSHLAVGTRNLLTCT